MVSRLTDSRFFRDGIFYVVRVTAFQFRTVGSRLTDSSCIFLRFCFFPFVLFLFFRVGLLHVKCYGDSIFQYIFLFYLFNSRLNFNMMSIRPILLSSYSRYIPKPATMVKNKVIIIIYTTPR